MVAAATAAAAWWYVMEVVPTRGDEWAGVRMVLVAAESESESE